MMKDEIVAFLRQHDGYVIAGHRDPDGDSLGSSMALALGLEQLGKHTEVVTADAIAPAYAQLPRMDRIVRTDRLPEGFPVAVLVECNGVERSGLTGFEGRRIVNIDHHANNPRFGDVNWIDPEVAAAGVMIYRLLDGLGVEMTPEIATHVYVAILTDTGSFRHANANPEAFRLGADLLEAGVDAAAVASCVYENVPAAKTRLMGRALAGLVLEDDGRIAWMLLPFEAFRDYPGEPDTEGIINHAKAVEGVDVAVLFKEVRRRRYRISLRSTTRVDVAAIATGFGGGGHPRAAGCSLDGDFEGVRGRVLTEVRVRLGSRPGAG